MDNLRISREFELLLCLARTEYEFEMEEKIKTLVDADIDWQCVLDQAQWHALTPLLHGGVRRVCPDRLPKAISEQLRSQYLDGAQRNLIMTGELITILEVLGSEGIIAVPYKGPVLASTVYGDLKLRRFSDLDLVVLEHDVKIAKALLIANRYRWIPEDDNLLSSNEYSFVGPSNVTIDLHWGISKPTEFPFLIDLTALWPRLERVTFANRTVYQFPANELLLFLCVHGSKDLWWLRLAWICDIAELIRVRQDIDWHQVVDQARQLGSQRMLFLGLRLANELFQAPIPSDVLERIQADPAVTKLTAEVTRKLFQENVRWYRPLEKRIFHLKVRERWTDKIVIYRSLLRRVFTRIFVPKYVLVAVQRLYKQVG